ncbi:uncharacterized protein METZ01_LOCUS460831, partial [marine metagenome]
VHLIVETPGAYYKPLTYSFALQRVSLPNRRGPI